MSQVNGIVALALFEIWEVILDHSTIKFLLDSHASPKIMFSHG